VLLRHLSDVRSMPDVVTGEGVDGYSELDVRLGWRLSEELELSVVGQNLLHDEHVEFGSPAARGAIERSIYGKLTWGF
jgi:iron complex outermembrane receptor protein